MIIDPLPEELSLSEHEVYEMDKCAKMISKKFPKSSKSKVMKKGIS